MVDAYYAIRPRLIQLSRSLNLLFCTATSTTSILGQHDHEVSVHIQAVWNQLQLDLTIIRRLLKRYAITGVWLESAAVSAYNCTSSSPGGTSRMKHTRGLAMRSGSTELQICPWRG